MMASTKKLKSVPHLCFGTYRLNGLILKDAAAQAMSEFKTRNRPQLLDGAFKYQNLNVLVEILEMYPQAKIGYKVEHGKSMTLKEQLEILKKKVPNQSRIFRILLHNYSGGKNSYLKFQETVESLFGNEMSIGICNISEEQLKDLVSGADADTAAQ